MKLQPSGTYELIDAGVYESEIDSVTPEDANERFDDAKPQLKFIFLCDTGEDEPSKVFTWTGQTYGPQSKLRPWLAVLLPDFDPDKDALETDDLVGLKCRAVVTRKKNKEGREVNRVAEVLPLEPRKRGQPAAAGRVVDTPPF